MGSRLAARLLQAGYPLMVYDRTHAKTLPLAQLGARIADTPATWPHRSSVVFSSLADDDAVEGGAARDLRAPSRGQRPGTIFIEMSTILPETSRTLAAAARAREMDLLDAAVSGSTPQVEAGTITLLVGGDQTVYERCRADPLDLDGALLLHGAERDGDVDEAGREHAAGGRNSGAG